MTPEMTTDRWRHIDRLFHSTLECAQEKRASFLSQACPDDHDLRIEVESLLRAHEQDELAHYAREGAGTSDRAMAAAPASASSDGRILSPQPRDMRDAS